MKHNWRLQQVDVGAEQGLIADHYACLHCGTSGRRLFATLATPADVAADLPADTLPTGSCVLPEDVIVRHYGGRLHRVNPDGAVVLPRTGHDILIGSSLMEAAKQAPAPRTRGEAASRSPATTKSSTL